MFDNCVFLIPARKGSKGFPGKNRKLFDDTVCEIPNSLNHKVYVSSDDPAIEDRASSYNFNYVLRPDDISTDESSVKDVLQHFIKTENISDDTTIILLYLTYPERVWNDIVEMYINFLESGANSLVCCEEVSDHPYLTFYEKENGTGELVVKHSEYRRQDYPKCFKQSLFFACYKAHIVDNLHGLLFEKNTVFHKLTGKRKIDVDYESDYLQCKE